MKKIALQALAGLTVLSMGMYMYSQNSKNNEELSISSQDARSLLEALSQHFNRWQTASAEISHLLPALVVKWQREGKGALSEKWPTLKQTLLDFASQLRIAINSPEAVSSLREKNDFVKQLQALQKSIDPIAQESGNDKEFVLRSTFAAGKEIITKKLLDQIKELGKVKESKNAKNESETGTQSESDFLQQQEFDEFDFDTLYDDSQFDDFDMWDFGF